MSDDLIRRSDAIRAFNECLEKSECGTMLDDDRYYKRLKDLPSADRPQGKWVLDPNGMDWNIPAWRCSRCGFVANYIGTETNGLGRNPMNWAGSKYCPNCGAHMKGADDD